MPIFLNVELTEEQKKNQFLDDDGNEIYVVYRLSEDEQTAELLYDFYDERFVYRDTDIVVPLKWAFNNKFSSWEHGVKFRNVKGSSKDQKKPATYERCSWVGFFENVTGYPVTRGYEKPIIIDDKKTKSEPFGCNATYCPYCQGTKGIVGGHVTLNEAEQNYVGILPICSKHNVISKGGKGTGLGFQMELDHIPEVFEKEKAIKVPMITREMSHEIFADALEEYKRQNKRG